MSSHLSTQCIWNTWVHCPHTKLKTKKAHEVLYSYLPSSKKTHSKGSRPPGSCNQDRYCRKPNGKSRTHPLLRPLGLFGCPIAKRRLAASFSAYPKWIHSASEATGSTLNWTCWTFIRWPLARVFRPTTTFLNMSLLPSSRFSLNSLRRALPSTSSPLVRRTPPSLPPSHTSPFQAAALQALLPPMQTRGIKFAPKRSSSSKTMKGRIPIRIGGSTRGTTLAFGGEYGIRAKSGVRLRAKQLEAAYEALRRKLKPFKGVEIMMRVFPDRPIAVKVCFRAFALDPSFFFYHQMRIFKLITSSFILCLSRVTKLVWVRVRECSITGLASELKDFVLKFATSIET